MSFHFWTSEEIFKTEIFKNGLDFKQEVLVLNYEVSFSRDLFCTDTVIYIMHLGYYKCELRVHLSSEMLNI